MKNFWILVVSSMLPLLASSQGGMGAFGSGAYIVCSGAPTITCYNSGFFELQGATFIPAQSLVKFTGNAAMSSSRFWCSNFYNVEVNKTSNNVRLLNNNCTIQNRLTLTSGTVNVGSKRLNFATSPDAKIFNEQNTNPITGTTGHLYKQYNFTANGVAVLPGRLGIEITPTTACGLTTVRRYFTSFLVAPNINSIKRYYSVDPATAPGSTQLKLYYSDNELNGNSEVQLSVYRSTDGGTTWTEMGWNSTDNTDNWVTVTVPSSTANVLYTLAFSSYYPRETTQDVATIPTLDIQDWSISPSPADNSTNIRITSQTEGLTNVQWYNSAGTLLLVDKVNLTKGENTIPQNTAELPSGMYFVKVEGTTLPAKPVQITH